MNLDELMNADVFQSDDLQERIEELEDSEFIGNWIVGNGQPGCLYDNVASFDDFDDVLEYLREELANWEESIDNTEKHYPNMYDPEERAVLHCSREELDSIKEECEFSININRERYEISINESDEFAELHYLRQLHEKYPGHEFIADSYFVDYTKQFIEDCCSMPKEFNSGEWPWRHCSIDYEAAASELQGDYEDVEIKGVSFWVRES